MNAKVFIYDIDYRAFEDRVSILLYGRTEEGRTVSIYDPSYKPYFYVLPTDIDRAEKDIMNLLKKKKFSIEDIQRCRLIHN
jgi:hypothetical protein